MNRVISVILLLFGAGLLFLALIVWDQIMTSAWQTGGVTSSLLFFGLMVLIAFICILLSFYYWRRR